MSFVVDTGAIPSGTTSQEQLVTWDKDKTKPNFDIKDTMVQSIMRYNQLFTVKTEITIPGDFTIKAGDLVECSFPALSGDESKDINSETKGIYMVASVCHRITPNSSTTSLSLVRDSFGGK
jgi:cytochrome c